MGLYHGSRLQRQYSPQDVWFSWVIDERIALPIEQAPGQWVAWGHNCDLHLARRQQNVTDHGLVEVIITYMQELKILKPLNVHGS